MHCLAVKSLLPLRSMRKPKPMKNLSVRMALPASVVAITAGSAGENPEIQVDPSAPYSSIRSRKSDASRSRDFAHVGCIDAGLRGSSRPGDRSAFAPAGNGIFQELIPIARNKRHRCSGGMPGAALP